MARTFITGFATGDATTDGIILSGAHTVYETTIVRTGPRSLKIFPGSGVGGQVTGPSTAPFGRFYVRVTVRPSSLARSFYGSVSSGLNFRLNANGTIGVYDGGVLRGTSATALTDTSRWYQIEFGTGTSVPLLKIDGVTEVTSTATSCLGGLGPNDAPADTYTMYVADWSLDSSQFPGSGAVVLHLPISDNARAAKWVAGSNATVATTNLFQGVNNTPPTGTATSNAVGNAISHEGSGVANEDYDANMTTFSTLGVGTLANRAGDLVVSGTTATIGAGAAGFYVATSFTAAASGDLKAVAVPLAKTGSPTDNVLFELWSDSAGQPNAKIADIGTILASAIGATEVMVPAAGITLVSGTTYWVVAKRSGSLDAANFRSWTFNNAQRGTEDRAIATSAPVWSVNTTSSLALMVCVGTGDVVVCMQPMAVHGEDIATGTKTAGFGLKSNPTAPTFTTFNAGNDVGAVGVYPSNWVFQGGIFEPLPAVTVGSSPVMTARRTGTESRRADFCFMGIYTEFYTPPAASGLTLTGGVASATAVASAGSLSLGAVTVSGTAAVATASAVAGSLSMAFTAMGGVASASAVAAAGSLTKGPLTISGTAAVVTAAAQAGALTVGGITISATAASATAVAVTGVITLAVTLSGTVASASAVAQTGALTLGGITVSGAVAPATAVAQAGALTLGGLTISGTAALVTAVAVTGVITQPINLSGAVASASAVAQAGALTLGGITVSGAVAPATVVATAGALTLGGVTISGTAAVVTAVAVAGVITQTLNLSGAVASASAVAPTGVLTLGGITVSGTVAPTTAAAATGSLTLGGLTISGTAAVVNAVAVAGALGSTTLISGGVAAVTAVANPGTLALGALTVSGGVASAVAQTAAGSVALGALTITGGAAPVAATAQTGALTLGVLTIAGTAAVVTAVAAPGSISGSLTITGGVASATAVAATGVLTKGPLTISGAPAIVTVVALAGSGGSGFFLSGTVASASAVAATGVLALGALTITGAGTQATAVAQTGALTLGNVTLSGSAALATAASAAGSLTLGPRTITGTVASATAVAAAGSLTLTLIVSGGIAGANAVAATGALSFGPITISGAPAIVNAVAFMGSINVPTPWSMVYGYQYRDIY